jgi:hypothetical protein
MCKDEYLLLLAFAKATEPNQSYVRVYISQPKLNELENPLDWSQ